MRRTTRIALILSLGLSLALLSAWVQACRIATRPVNPDENQFVASAAMLAREGKLPYRDFPYMHLPYQTLALAGLYRAGAGHLLLAARVMNGALGLMTLGLVAGLIVAAGGRRPAAWALGAAAALALLFNPLFAYTSGMAWNHDGSTALTLASVAALWRWRATRSPAWSGTAGLLLSLAVGVRATVVPLAIPMIAALAHDACVGHGPTRRAVAWFVIAGLIGLIPTAVLAALAPEQFVWGNLEYARLNTQLRLDTAFGRAMSLRGKLTYLRDVVFAWDDHRRGDRLLLAWAAAASGAALVMRRTARPPAAVDLAPAGPSPAGPPLLMLAALVPFALLGALLPTPSWAQYYYALMPVLLVAAGATLARALTRDDPTRPADAAPSGRRRSAVAAASVATLTAVAAESAHALLPDERGLRWPAVVVPLEVHRYGMRLAAPEGGRVWTIDPLYPLEGGRVIFPEMTPGGYAYRVAALVPAERRARLRLIDAADLAARLDAEPTPPTLLLRTQRTVNGRPVREEDDAARELAGRRGWPATPLDPQHDVVRP